MRLVADVGRRAALLLAVSFMIWAAGGAREVGPETIAAPWQVWREDPLAMAARDFSSGVGGEGGMVFYAEDDSVVQQWWDDLKNEDVRGRGKFASSPKGGFT